MYSACFALKENDEAKKWGERILSTRGSDIETAPLIDLGMVFYELNQFDEAYKYFNDSYNYVKKKGSCVQKAKNQIVKNGDGMNFLFKV